MAYYSGLGVQEWPVKIEYKDERCIGLHKTEHLKNIKLGPLAWSTFQLLRRVTCTIAWM
jgi:hypothetical protein